MAVVLPFRAIRPAAAYAEKVAALPYDVYSREEARAFVADHPLSFLNIDRPETQFQAEYDMYADEVYQKASDLLCEWRDQGIFVQEEQACYYIYELTMNGRAQTGIAALSSVDDYLNHVCRKHENTVAEKEKDRICHVDVCSAQTGPIFLAYRAQKEIREMVAEEKKELPLYDFISEDGICHRLWRIAGDEKLARMQQLFAEIPYTYIADGHHRAASAVKVGLKRREEHPDYTGREEFNYFLSVLFPDDELYIMDYNRVVKDLNGWSETDFLEQLESKFIITRLQDAAAPMRKGQISMYLDRKWYMLESRPELQKQRDSDPVRTLDVALLQEEVLTPLLGIGDPRTDKRIAFVGGIKGLETLVHQADAATELLRDSQLLDQRGPALAFAMYPTGIQELFAVADAGLLMPPKSTWFEPKLRSGLLIHEIER